jgi:hypothetical protein
MMTKVIPVFRAFDRKKVIEFYIDWLGFAINWEYHPDNSPFYMQISLRDIVIDISEHHGDATPGSKIVITDFEGLQAYHQSLLDKKYTYMKPGLNYVEWDKDSLETTVIDPFFNQLVFNEKVRQD